jgi:sugar lactone lactonase YvrE
VSGWEVAYRDDAEVAERPLWDAATGSLVWVDITGGLVHRLEIPGRHSKVAVSAPVGAAALRSRGGLVIAHDSELLFVAPDGTPGRAAVPFSHPPNIRFNDGACDPAGRFLIGTSSTDGRSGQGALYSVASDGNVTELLSDVTESNGLAWSLDGQTMYYVDSAHPEIRRYRYDAATGRLGKAGVLRSFGDDEGQPDGLVVDADGAIWAAMWEGWAVCRISPAGEVLERIATPVSRPTCPAFGGSRLDQLYLTTGWQGMPQDERSNEPLAGSVLVAAPGARGMQPFRFAG